MPEYLAPGVYVEEVDTGSKPIEGVSTSTAGMVGVTERGPLNVPVLVTGVGEFTHWYGGLLRSSDYADHRFLPHAVEGFFTNGGKRVYVTRVLDASATKAMSPLFDRGDATSVQSALVRPAGEGTGSAATPPVLVILPVTGPAAGDWVRVGDGSTAEYRQAAGASVAETVVVPVHLPLEPIASRRRTGPAPRPGRAAPDVHARGSSGARRDNGDCERHARRHRGPRRRRLRRDRRAGRRRVPVRPRSDAGHGRQRDGFDGAAAARLAAVPRLRHRGDADPTRAHQPRARAGRDREHRDRNRGGRPVLRRRPRGQLREPHRAGPARHRHRARGQAHRRVRQPRCRARRVRRQCRRHARRSGRVRDPVAECRDRGERHDAHAARRTRRRGSWWASASCSIPPARRRRSPSRRSLRGPR